MTVDLRALLEAATSGPWVADEYTVRTAEPVAGASWGRAVAQVLAGGLMVAAIVAESWWLIGGATVLVFIGFWLLWRDARVMGLHEEREDG